MTEKHVLGGRTFVPVTESTVEHDYAFLELAQKAGLGVELSPRGDETLDGYLQRVVLRVAGSGEILPMLGCLLIPLDRVADTARPGEAWTPEIGAETTRFIGSLTSEKDKEVIRGILPLLLFPFCEVGMRSWKDSATSSVASRPKEAPTKTASATGATAAGTT